MHKYGKYNTDTEKPKMIYYLHNSLKDGIDTFDQKQKCHEYNVTCIVGLFFEMLDQSGINSYIFFTLNVRNEKNVLHNLFRKLCHKAHKIISAVAFRFRLYMRLFRL